MPDTPTPNYGLNRPDSNDAMSDFETWLNANWDSLAAAPAPPSGTTLPQSGDYVVGDRFYKSDTESVYLLACADANWGWHWRPVQDAISPWMEVPTTCLDVAGSGWTLNPVAANPFAIAMDNRGKCYWRGVIGPSVGNITRNTSYGVFKPVPNGIRPRERGTWMLGHSTLSVGTSGSNLNAWQGARIFIADNDTSSVSVRCFGGSADPNRIHLSGVEYAVGTSKYTTP